MDSNKNYKTVTIPFFNPSNGVNKFEFVNNKFIVEYEIPQKRKQPILSLNKKGYKINNYSFPKHERLEFIIPEDYSQNLNFESDVTITYEDINGVFYLLKIDAMFSEDYVEIMDSGYNLYPEFVNGQLKFTNLDFQININSAC
jgi:hypothetical protein